jgi:hypothetical protein
VNVLFIGATALAYAAVAAFFRRFYLRSRDRLFLIFGAAFLVLALNRVALAMVDSASEGRTYLYLVRLCAFVLILWAIVDKNRAGGNDRG